jgi:hypothetical protein
MKAKAAAVQISRELLSLLIDRTPAPHVHERAAHPNAEALRAAVDEERTVEVLNQQPLHRPTVSSYKPEQRRGSRP